jgi:DNA-binding transcriptional MerR regulator
MRIGEVAALFDVTTKTLRHYEKLGLLDPEREENGYRLYGPEDVLGVQRIRQLQSLGLSLQEIGRLLGRDDEVVRENVLRSLREEATEEMALLEERLAWIEQLLDEGLPPDGENLPAPPGKVNEYLKQHLPEEQRQTWRRDTQVYASLQSALGPGGEAWGDAPFFGQPLMVPTGLAGELAAGTNGNGYGGPYRNGDGEQTVLRALQKYGHLIEQMEDEA